MLLVTRLAIENKISVNEQNHPENQYFDKETAEAWDPRPLIGGNIISIHFLPVSNACPTLLFLIESLFEQQYVAPGTLS